VRRLSRWLLPLVLALAGGGLIIAAQLDLDAVPSPSLPDIPDPTPTEVAVVSPTATASETAAPSASPTATPSPTPLPDDVVATQLQIQAVSINVRVLAATDPATCSFPPSEAAYVLCDGAQPGRNDNSYIFAHAINSLFKPLWNVRIGDEVAVLMSDGSVLRYRVTEVRPNVACPDPDADPGLNPEAFGVTLPLALQYAGDDCAEGVAWTRPVDHERLTLQTSQGYNRNWGELVVIADPIGR
jgi:Sortase domain